MYMHTVPKGTTVTCRVLVRCTKEPTDERSNSEKRRELVGRWKNLHHYNVRSHVAQTVIECLTIKGISMVPHPSHSTDLTSSDCFCVPLLKRTLRDAVLAMKYW